ncbi:MAG: hypothetical protein GY773_20955 [Actinomycetia bacterium]|nr:hypothetical protein [Actinomycetes bacterium]
MRQPWKGFVFFFGTLGHFDSVNSIRGHVGLVSLFKANWWWSRIYHRDPPSLRGIWQ